LEGITLLVLGNKNDIKGSLNEEELVNQLNLDKIKDR
jgi:hypothetical protein